MERWSKLKRVVVTGMGIISPVGNNIEEFWTSLEKGKSGIGYITKFDTTEYKVKIAAEVKNFNPLDYMDKSEARKEDLFSQYAMSAAVQAMKDSNLNVIDTEDMNVGIVGNNETQKSEHNLNDIESHRLGVYIGSGTGGMETFSKEYDKLIEKGPSRISPFLIPMMIGNMATGNVARKFKAKGVNLPIVTACATSTNAIGEAYRAIKHGYADAIITGGAEAAIVPLSVAGFTSAMALTKNPDPQTACRPFDKNRDGFVMGEGSGILVLEEYERAKKRGAKIYGEICGYGNTNDAFHMTAPDSEAISSSRAIKQAVLEAVEQNEINKLKDLSFEQIYINAHGTSTPLNDKTETFAIKKVFGENAEKLHISSTKSMTGHMLGSAGAVEAIATILALKNNMVPPTINYEQQDEACDLNYTPNKAVKSDLELGISISLGFGGHNSAIAFRKIKTD